MQDVLMERPHQPTALQRSRISQIVVRYLRTGTVTRAELCDIAMLPDQCRLVDFFAQRLGQ